LHARWGWARRSIGTLVLAAVLLGAQRAPTVYDLDRVGKPLPPVTVTLLDGTPFPLAGLRGRPAYVFLFASWCEPCVAALPAIKAAFRTYGERVRFLGIDVLEDRSAALALSQREALPFPVAFVDTATIDAVVSLEAREDGGPKYRLPADFVVDATGIVRGAWHGQPLDRDHRPVDLLPQRLERFLRL
jgi:thiol-disulfide isomerase/thioredoxin